MHLLANGAEGRHEVRAGELRMRCKNSVSLHDFLGGQIQSVVVEGLNLVDFLIDEACVSDSGDNVAGSGLAFRSNHRCTFPNASHSFAQSGGTANKRNAVVVLVDVEIRVSGREDFALVNHVNTHGFENAGLSVVSDAGLGHDRDGRAVQNSLNHVGVTHASDATCLSDVGWDTFERHHGNGTGVFGNGCLLGVHDVHDDASLLHSGESALQQVAAFSELCEISFHGAHTTAWSASLKTVGSSSCGLLNRRARGNLPQRFQRRWIPRRCGRSRLLRPRGHPCLQKWRQRGIRGCTRRNRCTRQGR